MKLQCWNVNGIRAVHKKGFLSWFEGQSPDILCLQETKAKEEQIPDDIRQPIGYHSYFESSREKSGYSGVALFSKIKPEKVERGIGEDRFDSEGRTLIAYYDDFVLLNIYFPNGKASAERLRFKMDFYEVVLALVKGMKDDGRSVIICGDVNTAHREIDLARPKENERTSGFLREERDWIDRLLVSGFIDTYRYFDPVGKRYTWWDVKTRARERDVGWRIDDFFISADLVPRLRSAAILADVVGSDHCPIEIELDDIDKIN
jgi:exodeoxyribonuclease-3